jgi:alpha-tubulin suppressor-like RCC1 family protein
MPSSKRMQMATAGQAGGGFEGGGTLWGWGRNAGRQVGNGNDNVVSVSVQIGSDDDWIRVWQGRKASMGLKSDGSLYSWGSANKGSTSQGNTTDLSVPTQIGSSTNWGGPLDHYDNSFASGSHGMAIDQDGKLYAMGGDNEKGNFGLGHTSNSVSAPTQVGSLTNWAQVTVGSLFTTALKTDGTLWGFGNGDSGRLGDGSTTIRSSPVQVGSQTYWTWISSGYDHAMAITTGGKLFGWGNNQRGALGLGDMSHRSSPVQVGSLTNWSKVYCGGNHTIALKTDGTLWSFGGNYYGQLGHGDATTGAPYGKNSPIQIGSRTDWVSGGVNGGGGDSFGVTSGGLLFSWGENHVNQGGRGNTTAVSSPVQIGTGYNRVNGGSHEAVFAIKTA